MDDTAKILISIGSTLIAGLTAGVTGLFKNKQKQKKLENQLKELLNYTFGIVDMLLNDKIAIKPNLKKQLQEASDRYHSMDLLPKKERNTKNV